MFSRGRDVQVDRLAQVPDSSLRRRVEEHDEGVPACAGITFVLYQTLNELVSDRQCGWNMCHGEKFLGFLEMIL